MDDLDIEDLVPEPPRTTKNRVTHTSIPARYNTRAANDIRSYNKTPRELTHIETMDEIYDIYATLMELKMPHHPILDACVRQAWRLRHQWLLRAYVPTHYDAERVSWTRSLVCDSTRSGT